MQYRRRTYCKPHDNKLIVNTEDEAKSMIAIEYPGRNMGFYPCPIIGGPDIGGHLHIRDLAARYRKRARKKEMKKYK